MQGSGPRHRPRDPRQDVRPHRGRQADAGPTSTKRRLSAGDGFLVAARALGLGLGLPRQVAGLVPARRQLAHLHRAVLRVDAAATTRVPGYDVGKRIVRAAVVHRHGVWIMPLPLRYYASSGRTRRSWTSARRTWTAPRPGCNVMAVDGEEIRQLTHPEPRIAFKDRLVMQREIAWELLHSEGRSIDHENPEAWVHETLAFLSDSVGTGEAQRFGRQVLPREGDVTMRGLHNGLVFLTKLIERSDSVELRMKLNLKNGRFRHRGLNDLNRRMAERATTPKPPPAPPSPDFCVPSNLAGAPARLYFSRGRLACAHR
jgi:hypothetical protein